MSDSGAAPGFARDPLTRRSLLIGASRLAMTTGLGGMLVVTLAGCARPEAEPWADDTYFADGTGWAE